MLPLSLAGVYHVSNYRTLLRYDINIICYPVPLQACITFQRFRPGTRVMREVMFTKCLYAQISQQKFTPDKRSGYTVPPSSSSKFKAYDLGAKLVRDQPLNHIIKSPLIHQSQCLDK